jgi:hypothetical protein
VTLAPPITWTCDPPEFAAYVSHVDIIDRGDFVYVDVDMRCKRVPAHAGERKEWRRDTDEPEGPGGYTYHGVLDISFAAHLNSDPEYNIVWPSWLGPWTGKRPTLSVTHGRTDLGVEFFSQGRYTMRVVLMRRDLPRNELKPGNAATLAAHEHGANHGRKETP